jgi:hypothetical protein
MTNTHIPHLPNEILYEVVSYVADEDVLNLRMSARIFQSITANRFAVTFFEDRAYDMSLQGLKALVEITEQPSFARHIKTVIIGHGGKIYPGEHHDLLVQAFRNLVSTGNTISLGLRQVRKCRNYRRRHNVVLRQTYKFFRDKVLAAAIRARMPLEDFVADIQSTPQNRKFRSVMDDWIRDIRHDLSNGTLEHVQFKGLKIKLSLAGSDCTSGHFYISDNGQILEVVHAGSWDWRHYLWYAYWTNLHRVVLEDCIAESGCIARMLEGSGYVLQYLSLYNVCLKECPPGPTGTWMSLFASPNISLRRLKSCKLGYLWDKPNGCWLEGGDKTIEANTRAQVSTVLSNLAAGVRTFTLDD